MKNKDKNAVMKHLKDDIETFHEEASEDKKLIRSLKKKKFKRKVGPLVKAVAKSIKKKK